MLFKILTQKQCNLIIGTGKYKLPHGERSFGELVGKGVGDASGIRIRLVVKNKKPMFQLCAPTEGWSVKLANRTIPIGLKFDGTRDFSFGMDYELLKEESALQPAVRFTVE